MELPDLEQAYSYSRTVYDAAQKVITDALEVESVEEIDETDIPDYISYEVLAQEIVQLQNKLFSSDKKEDQIALEKLNRLDAVLLEIMIQDGVVSLPGNQSVSSAPSNMANDQVEVKEGSATPPERDQQGAPQ
jgi:hypothetical protein